MTAPRYTPGPWQWDEGRHYLRPAMPDPDNQAVHTILDIEYGYTGYIGSDRTATQAEGEANLTLIQAAPELLEALQYMVRSAKAPDWGGRPSPLALDYAAELLNKLGAA